MEMSKEQEDVTVQTSTQGRGEPSPWDFSCQDLNWSSDDGGLDDGRSNDDRLPGRRRLMIGEGGHGACRIEGACLSAMPPPQNKVSIAVSLLALMTHRTRHN